MIKKNRQTGWNTNSLRVGKTLKFEDGSSVTRITPLLVGKKRAPRKSKMFY